jgi:hypothetical protein
VGERPQHGRPRRERRGARDDRRHRSGDGRSEPPHPVGHRGVDPVFGDRRGSRVDRGRSRRHREPGRGRDRPHRRGGRRALDRRRTRRPAGDGGAPSRRPTRRVRGRRRRGPHDDARRRLADRQRLTRTPVGGARRPPRAS